VAWRRLHEGREKRSRMANKATTTEARTIDDPVQSIFMKNILAVNYVVPGLSDWENGKNYFIPFQISPV
jgi:hypothetical protein